MKRQRKRPGASRPDSKLKTSESPATLYRDHPAKPISPVDHGDLDPQIDWDRRPEQLKLNFGGAE